MISVDPGINGCGAALYSSSVLIDAQYTKNPFKKNGESHSRVFYMAKELVEACGWDRPDRLIVERPRVYMKSKTNPDNIMVLAEIGACISGMFGVTAEPVRPHEWKGSISPEECTRRVRARLSNEEFQRIDLPKNTCAVCRMKEPGLKECLKPHSCLAHNVYDAIGLGLFALGRFGRYRVIS